MMALAQDYWETCKPAKSKKSKAAAPTKESKPSKGAKPEPKAKAKAKAKAAAKDGKKEEKPKPKAKAAPKPETKTDDKVSQLGCGPDICTPYHKIHRFCLKHFGALKEHQECLLPTRGTFRL